MVTSDDPAVLEALRRRRVREVRGTRAFRVKWLLWSLLPVPLFCMHGPLWLFGVFVFVFCTGPLMIVWLMFCTGKLMRSVPPGMSKAARFCTGVAIFVGLLLLNAVAIYAVLFLAHSVDWLYKRLT